MKRAKVRHYRRTRRGISWRARLPAMFRYGLYSLSRLLPLLPFAAVAVIFLLPSTPHVRVSYTYTGTYSDRYYVTCHYLGINGFVQQVFGSDCPIVAFMRKGAHS